MNQTFAVAEARAQLVEAEAAQQEERRKRLIEQLGQTREELRAANAKLEKLRADLLQLQAAYDAKRKALELCDELIGMHHERRPAVAEYLPNDPDAAAWSKRERELKAERARVLNARLALPNIEQMRLDGARLARSVQNLMWTENSILGQLDGSIAQSPVGGIFAA